MIIEKILGNKDLFHNFESYQKDEVFLEWYELNKKVMRKTTLSGNEIGFRLNQQSDALHDGDILALDNGKVIILKVKSCQCIEIYYNNKNELAKLCYEIGNRHAPLFLSESGEDSFLIPFDSPIFDMLQKMNFRTRIREGLLTRSISANIPSHSH